MLKKCFGYIEMSPVFIFIIHNYDLHLEALFVLDKGERLNKDKELQLKPNVLFCYKVG